MYPDVPTGYDGIVETFGDIAEYVEDDGIISPSEEANFLTIMNLPFSMKYAYNTNITIKRMRCHILMVELFTDVFTDISDKNLEDFCTEFGGCYVFRPMRGSNKLSTHSWGIAVDLNPRTNQMNTAGDMHPDIVKIFKGYGFVWGGDWKRKDPMHFQYARNY